MKKKQAAPLLAPYGNLQGLGLAAKVGGGKGAVSPKDAEKTKFKVRRRKIA